MEEEEVMNGQEFDPISLALFTGALLVGLFLYIDAAYSYAFFALILLFGGAIGLQLSGPPKVLSSIDVTRDKTALMYAVVAIGAFLVMDLGANFAFAALSIVNGLSVVNAELFGVLMAVAEEFFFRGFLLFWLLKVTRSAAFSTIGSAAIFAVYHFAVYGASATDIFIVFGAGILLAFIALKTNSILPDTIAHIAINLLAFG